MTSSDQTNPPPDSPVKQRPDANPCSQCGKPTWSATGLCLKCAKGSPQVTHPPIQPTPVPDLPFPEPRLDHQGHLDEDIPCRRCGYNLKGLAPTRKCPECSHPIEQSIKGDSLHYANPDWVLRLAQGTRWMKFGYIISIVFGIFATVIFMSIGMAGSGMSGQIAVGYIGGGIKLLIAFGIWLLTDPDPGFAGPERILSARRLSRFGALGVILVALISGFSIPSGPLTFGPGIAGPTFPPWFVFIQIGTLAVEFIVVIGVIATLYYLRSLARRIPHAGLARHSGIVMWGYGIARSLALLSTTMVTIYLFFTYSNVSGGPGMVGIINTFGVGTCAGYIGMFIFGIWGLVLLFRFETAFQKCANAAKLDPIAPPNSPNP